MIISSPKKFKRTIPLNATGASILFFLFLAVLVFTSIIISILFVSVLSLFDKSSFEVLSSAANGGEIDLIKYILSKYSGPMAWINLPVFLITIYLGLKIFDGITLEKIFHNDKTSIITSFFSIIGSIGLLIYLSNFTPEPPENILDPLVLMLDSWPILGFTAICIMAPITEELFFRSFLIKGLIKYHSPWIAIFISSLIFGLVHMNVWQTPPAFFIGLYIGYIFFLTNNIFLVILIHFIINLIGILPIMYYRSDIVVSSQEPASYGIGILIFFVSLYFIMKDKGVIKL